MKVGDVVYSRSESIAVAWRFDGASFGATIILFQSDNLNDSFLWTVCEVPAPRTEWTISPRIVSMYRLANTGLPRELSLHERSGMVVLHANARYEIS